MDKTYALFFAQVLFRIVAIAICVVRARNMNRSQWGWAIFALIIPLVAIIVTFVMRDRTGWNYSKGRLTQKI